jgi:hypothetical protein
MGTEKEIHIGSIIKVINGEFSGEILKVTGMSLNEDFLDCQDKNEQRIGSAVKKEEIRLANQSETHSFGERANNCFFSSSDKE